MPSGRWPPRSLSAHPRGSVPPGMTYSKLSIVMPVFNEEQTIEIAVQRVLEAQLPLPFELLVVDDGSSDKSLEKIEHLLDEGPVRLIRQEKNLGKGAAIRS